jgi:hypothetical protein
LLSPDIDGKDAAKILTAGRMKSSYNSHFGDPPKAAEEYLVIKKKPLSQMTISKFLQDEAVSYIEKWIKINN